MTGAERFRRYHIVRKDLAKRFPAAIMSEGNKRPKLALAIGIHRDLAARAPDLSAEDRAIFFQLYTRGVRYEAARKTGVRVDLDGRVVKVDCVRMVGADRVSP